MSEDESRVPASRSRPRRWLAVAGFALGWLGRRMRRRPRQVATTVGVVALAVALLLAVTGIALQLAGEPAGGSDGADLRIVPAEEASLSAVVDAEGQRFGAVHERTARLEGHDSIVAASPVLVDVVRLRAPDSDAPAYVLAIGVVPGPDTPPVAGISTDALGAGDPHYANGTYDGEMTGDVLLSTGAAATLNASVGDPVRLQSATTGAFGTEYAVVGINEPTQAGGAEFPIVMLRLSELQSVAGAADGDLADQVVVRTADDADVRPAMDATFPNATVVDSGGADLATLRSDDIALALSVAAGSIGVGLSVLFVATTMGLAVEGDRQSIAVLAALGFAGRARLAIIAVTILGLTALGATAGLVLGAGSVAIANAIAQATVTSTPIARLGRWAIPYAGSVAMLAGLLAMPYPLFVAHRTNIVAELDR